MHALDRRQFLTRAAALLAASSGLGLASQLTAPAAAAATALTPRRAALYPAEDPREAQAKCIRDAWALHWTDTGAGAGVAMFAQYLIYGDPNFDCGLIDPYPSTVKRPSYFAWKAFARYL